MIAGPSLLAAVLLFGPTTMAADTVVDLSRGDRVVLDNLRGDVTIEAWDQDRLEVRLDDEDALSVNRSGSTVRLRPSGSGAGRRSVEISIRVPRWIDLEIGGPSIDVSVADIDGRVSVSNLRGDVTVQRSGGRVRVSTIEGGIVVLDARGDVEATSQSDDVTVVRASGAVRVHSGSGDVTLEDLSSAAVRAETQDGDIDFTGSIAPGGSYAFFVHDGDATIAMPPGASVQASVSTFDGEFESEFPVVIRRFTGGREFDFTLGDGSARLEIQVFDGEIRLLQRR